MDQELLPIVERELGETSAEIARVEEGLLHETYEVRCDVGEYVLQFASDADGRDELRRGLNWYVALEGSGIPVPRVVTEEPETFDGRTYILVERLPGETGKRDVSPERTLNAGRQLARIHDACSFDTVGRIRFDNGCPSARQSSEGGPEHRIRRTAEKRSKVLREGGLENVGQEIKRVLAQFGEISPEDVRPVLCHGDYSPDNVLFRGSEVTGILDFDRAYSGHNHWDLARAANSFWMHDPCSDWDVRAKFYEGYREVRGLDYSFERTEPLYRTVTLAVLVAGLLELGELSEYEQEFYSERILGAVERIEGV